MHNYLEKEDNKFPLIKNVIEDTKIGKDKNPIAH